MVNCSASGPTLAQTLMVAIAWPGKKDVICFTLLGKFEFPLSKSHLSSLSPAFFSLYLRCWFQSSHCQLYDRSEHLELNGGKWRAPSLPENEEEQGLQHPAQTLEHLVRCASLVDQSQFRRPKYGNYRAVFCFFFFLPWESCLARLLSCQASLVMEMNDWRNK